MAIRHLLVPGAFSPSPGYECTFCGASSETERLNCPACGFDVLEVS